MSDPTGALPSEVIESGANYSLDELCSACKVEAEWVAGLVEQGVIEPLGQSRSDWQFTSIAVVRVARASRLERDLSLNTAGVALALDLLDEIEKMRAQLRSLEARRWP